MGRDFLLDAVARRLSFMFVLEGGRTVPKAPAEATRQARITVLISRLCVSAAEQCKVRLVLTSGSGEMPTKTCRETYSESDVGGEHSDLDCRNIERELSVLARKEQERKGAARTQVLLSSP